MARCRTCNSHVGRTSFAGFVPYLLAPAHKHRYCGSCAESAIMFPFMLGPEYRE